MKPRIHIPEPLESVELALWFKPARVGVFNEQFPPNFFETAVDRVAPEAAQVIVLPNNFKTMSPAAAQYIATYAEKGERLGIPVFVFSTGDFTDRIPFDVRVRVFTFSVYRSHMRANDIVIPTLTEDNAAEGIMLRQKMAKPLVSFCGMAGFPTWRRWVVYGTKIVLRTLQGQRARIIGVYWRRAAMRACTNSPLVDTQFIIRRSFSGNLKSIELDPAQARREFFQSVIASDFVIAPKGDGNYSNRFLEALSMGRIPVLIDTDAVLPLEDTIDYAKVVVTVPMNRVNDMANYVREFYDSLTEEEWQARQQLARETFAKYLRQDSFFMYFFSQLLMEKNV